MTTKTKAKFAKRGVFGGVQFTKFTTSKGTVWKSPKQMLNKEIFAEMQWLNAERRADNKPLLEWAKFKKSFLAR